MAFIDLYKELETAIPAMPSMLAQKLVQRSWNDIRKMRAWSFLYAYANIPVPAQINAGNVSVTFNTNTVVFNATAQAAILPFLLGNPSFAGGLGLGYQFRTPIGPIYTIIAYDYDGSVTGVPGTATLDNIYVQPTNAISTYQCYKCYYSLSTPVPRRVYSISNLTSSYSITNRSLLRPQSTLNTLDPQRTQQGDSYCISDFIMDQFGGAIMEFYPHPTSLSVYTCLYRHGGFPLSQTQSLPPDVDDSMVMGLAYLHANKWAQANVGNFPQLQSTNWVSLAQQQAKDFRDTLIQNIKDDDEKLTQLPFFQRLRASPLPGGAYLQGHDVSSLVGVF